ncbi:MAG: hypothetical protein K2W96_15285, partial [Gemmataceae bacterium]|nr:hypothetical protein [Gemmataceae bacterium]
MLRATMLLLLLAPLAAARDDEDLAARIEKWSRQLRNADKVEIRLNAAKQLGDLGAEAASAIPDLVR